MRFEQILPGSERHTVALRLLQQADLPVDDLMDGATRLYGAHEGEALLGVVGLQDIGRDCLLRSLAVPTAQRGKQIGGQLVRHVETVAEDNGCQALYLLTEGAFDFFLKRGYEELRRDKVPASVRQTEQYRHLCPASARVMVRSSVG